MGDKVFKIKHNGQKLKVRMLGENEAINPKCLQSFANPGRFKGLSDQDVAEELNRIDWQESFSVGETPSDHPERTYIEVMSPFYQGGSLTQKEAEVKPLK